MSLASLAVVCALAVVGAGWIVTEIRHGCTPGAAYTRRSGACVQFCGPDGRSFYPLCMIPHPAQHPDAWAVPTHHLTREDP